MSLFDVLNTDKDSQALNAVIDHAVQALTAQIVPAIQAAGDEMVDRLGVKVSEIVSQVNHDAMSDWYQIVGAVHGEIGQLRAELALIRVLLERLDGANVTLRLGK